LAPENTEEEAEIPVMEEQSQEGEAEQRDPFDRAADYMRQARGGEIGAATSEPGHEPDAERQATDWLARRDHHAAAISTLSQPDFAGYEQPSAPDMAEGYAEPQAGAEAEYETNAGISADSHAEDAPETPPAPTAQSWWQRFRAHAKSEPQPEAEAEPEAEAAEEDDSERFSARDFSFGNERADEPHDQDGQPDERRFVEEPATLPPAFGANAKSASEPSWPEFSATAWRETSSPAPDVAEPDFEEAEAEIREALRSALENPPEEAAAFPKADTNDAGGESDWRSRWNLGNGDNAEEAAPQTERFSFASRFDADLEEDEPSPFRLTGKTAKFPVFGVRDQADEEDDADPRSSDFEDDIEDSDRPGAVPKRAGKAEANVFDEREPASDFGSVFDERIARGSDDGEFLGDDFDDEAAALQQRFESTDLAEYQRARSYGGLAIAAAWAVFFSIISGIALAFVSFRQDIMAALPGTRSLYHTLGFAVADNPVDFSDVSYRWTTVEGKPMIEVTGQVVNITERTVKVPRVLVNVRDGASRGPVQATANVQADSLAPKESANFTLEFVSPSKDISQIELEFDENR
jgi:hypothetical protein